MVQAQQNKYASDMSQAVAQDSYPEPAVIQPLCGAGPACRDYARRHPETDTCTCHDVARPVGESLLFTFHKFISRII